MIDITEHPKRQLHPGTLIDMETLERVAPIIRIAAHPLRLRVLDYLEREGDARSVGEIVEACGVGQAVVSQQLRLLKDQGILAARRGGSNVFYRIADISILNLLDCIRQHHGASGQGELPPLKVPS